MIESVLDTLTQRLDRLERQNRRLKRAMALACVGVLGVVLVGAAAPRVPDEVRTKKLVVVDDKGRPRIVLGKARDVESFGLALLSTKSVIAAELFENELVGGEALLTALVLSDIKGNPHVDLNLYSDDYFDRSRLWLWGEYQLLPGTGGFQASPESIQLEVVSDRDTRNPRLTSKRSTASLRLRTGRVGAGYWLDGKDAGMDFSSYEGAPPAVPLAPERGSISIGLYNDRPTLTLADALFGPRFIAGHTSLRTRAGLVEQLPAGSLVLFDNDSKVIWKAP